MRTFLIAVTVVLTACESQPEPTANTATPTATATATTKATASASATAKATASAAASSAPAMVQADVAVIPELPPLPPMEVPADDPPTKEKVELGKVLFYDGRLGKDGKFACENCHHADKGWTDGKPLSEKGDGKMNTRHSPTLFNVGYQKAWYWDGRAPTLEAQVLAAWKSQLGVGDGIDARVAEIAKVAKYKEMFKAAFGTDDIKSEHVVKALASFVRTIRSGDAPFDKFDKGDKKAISESAARGWEIFRNKAGCAACHAPPLFTDLGFHNAGVGSDAKEPDKGRAAATKDDKDLGKFKTPTMRSVSTHAPYFHDGSAKSLEDAVDFMLGGGKANPNLDSGLKKVELKKDERADLIAFLKALEPKAEKFEKPKVP